MCYMLRESDSSIRNKNELILQQSDRQDNSVDDISIVGDFYELLRYYRRRKTQIHNGEPWSQEDLAVAIGSDKSHICRIETGKQLPMPKTLDRICDALELTWLERKHLISLINQSIIPPSPTPNDIEQAIQHVKHFIDNLDNPAVLLDIEGRIWYMNDLHAFCYYGYQNRDACLGDLSGSSCIELLMNPIIETWLRKVIVDYNVYVRRQVARFWHVFLGRGQQEEYQILLNRLLSVEWLRLILFEVVNNLNYSETSPFLNSQLLTIQHPEVGWQHFQVFHCVLSSGSGV